MATSEPIILEISAIICQHKDLPAIELRRRTNNTDLVKTITIHAIKGTPIKILPVFKNRLQSFNSLIQKGIIRYNPETSEYEFLI